MNKTENLSPERAERILIEQVVENRAEDKEFLEAMRMGAEAIECCMIAKKPEINKYCQVLCPGCSGTVFRHYDYCRGCGQKLDWSDVE